MDQGKLKTSLHERNKHRGQYNFRALVQKCPDLQPFVSVNAYGNESIDFSNPEAVKTLNRALLRYFYRIEFWDIPDNYLCPPIPGRADYIHYVADLLAVNGEPPRGKQVKVLDVGVGANCVYPIIGCNEYNWSFVGSEIDEVAFRNAKNIVEMNSCLSKKIEIRLQQHKNQVFKGIIRKEEKFDLVICNPPFHASAADALKGSQRKVRNLGGKNYVKPILNFGGQPAELWTEGGELGFISRMIVESKVFAPQCRWFSTLVSKSEHLMAIYAQLKKAEVGEIRTNEMLTGNKVARIVAWHF